jgi:hypothetical protein
MFEKQLLDKQPWMQVESFVQWFKKFESDFSTFHLVARLLRANQSLLICSDLALGNILTYSITPDNGETLESAKGSR